MKRTLSLIVCMLFSSLSTTAQNPAPPPPPKPPAKQIVTAAQVNGTYRSYKSWFRIQALGHNKLKVQFDGVYTTLSKSINMGYAMGEAVIDGNIATFKPPDTERCEITLVFLKNKLRVEQEGSDADCGFGHNVNATGIYRKNSAGKPKFEPPV